MHYRDPHYTGILHYVVQINGGQNMGWRSGTEWNLIPPLRETGCLRLDPIDWPNVTVAEGVILRDRDWIWRALHRSVDLFHEKWDYEFFRFNCEHWARLVATGVCRCHQMENYLELVRSRLPLIGNMAAKALEFLCCPWEYNQYAQNAIWD